MNEEARARGAATIACVGLIAALALGAGDLFFVGLCVVVVLATVVGIVRATE